MGWQEVCVRSRSGGKYTEGEWGSRDGARGTNPSSTEIMPSCSKETKETAMTGSSNSGEGPLPCCGALHALPLDAGRAGGLGLLGRNPWSPYQPGSCTSEMLAWMGLFCPG